MTDIVRTDGVFGNWVWWCFLPSGMLTAFLYARLWRRLGVVTDLEFYELRYNGRAAAFLRGFRAVYLGLIFNVLIIANVSLAAIKIGGVMLGLQPWQSILFAMIATVIFTSLGGFRGVLITDFLLFIVAMTGSFGAAYFAIQQPEVGGLDGLIAHFQQDPALAQKLEINQAVSPEQWIAVFLIPISIVWWSAWYPGAEPGGGGYVVQRMLSAKNENHAVGATFFFNIFLQHCTLCPASMAVDPGRTGINGGISGTQRSEGTRGDLPAPVPDPERHCLFPDADKTAGRLDRAGVDRSHCGVYVHLIHSAQLGRELSCERCMETLHPPRGNTEGTGLDG